MELEERAALFDDCFEVCRDVYEDGDGDGYQRQSAIRFAAELYPRLASRTIGAEFTDDALPGEHTVEETATHRSRLRGLYLEALADDDGRVRRAAAEAIKELALTAEMTGADEELRTMLEESHTLAARQPESKAKHIEQAYDNVAFHAGEPILSLAGEVQDVSGQSESAHSTDRLERQAVSRGRKGTEYQTPARMHRSRDSSGVGPATGYRARRRYPPLR
jgi:hypothetical protein